ALRAEAAARDRRVGVALDVGDPAVLHPARLPAPHRAVRTDRLHLVGATGARVDAWCQLEASLGERRTPERVRVPVLDLADDRPSGKRTPRHDMSSSKRAEDSLPRPPALANAGVSVRRPGPRSPRRAPRSAGGAVPARG